MCPARKWEAVLVLVVLLIVQLTALNISHKIVEWKNSRIERMHGLALVPGKEWHAFFTVSAVWVLHAGVV